MGRDRKLNLQQRQIQRWARMESGLCQKCGQEPADKPRMSCVTCLSKSRASVDGMRAKRLALGLCWRCGKRPLNINVGLCVECKTKWNKRGREQGRARRAPFREATLDHYGRKCACCGETELMFLTVDHIDNNGAEHRKEVTPVKICEWLVENNFPNGFQILCFNCNCGRYRNGGVCPHLQTGA